MIKFSVHRDCLERYWKEKDFCLCLEENGFERVDSFKNYEADRKKQWLMLFLKKQSLVSEAACDTKRMRKKNQAFDSGKNVIVIGLCGESKAGCAKEALCSNLWSCRDWCFCPRSSATYRSPAL